MPQPVVVVDAFTPRRFAGNPAAVCVLDGERDETWMRGVAREMNLSETAFLVPAADGWSLRWFTPAVEVDLCGHATLASAHVLWEDGRAAPADTIRFQTQSGLLTARRDGDWIELDFPATPAVRVEPPEDLAALLGATPRWVGESRFDLLVELENEETVRALRPNLHALPVIPARGIIVTAVASGKGAAPEEPYDFVSRGFFPASGVDEDPVTGSAHCTLGPYWGAKLAKTSLTGYQCSVRGGSVRVRLAGDRVVLGGRAVTVMRGALVEG
jgi:PhzF family phenazine biosynthesis protein